MAASELNADALSARSGVSGPTITRFLTGRHAEIMSVTVCKLARGFGVTEAQLRGLEPIEGIRVESPGTNAVTLKTVLTVEELTVIEYMRSLKKETRQAWLEIGKELYQTETKKELIEPKQSSQGIHKRGLIGVRYSDPKSFSDGGLQKKA